MVQQRMIDYGFLNVDSATVKLSPSMDSTEVRCLWNEVTVVCGESRKSLGSLGSMAS